MIISCPKCNSGFFVSQEQIGATGRRVKCSKCKNIWHAVIEGKSEAEALPKNNLIMERIQASSVSANINLPAIIPIKIPSFLLVAPTTLLMFISLTLWLFYPNLTNKIGLCGPLCTAEGLRIEDLDYKYDEVAQKVKIEYAIANRSNKIAQLPQVQFKLINDKNKISKIAYANSNNLDIQPDSSIKAKTELEAVSADSSIIQITLGNPIKFWFR